MQLEPAAKPRFDSTSASCVHAAPTASTPRPLSLSTERLRGNIARQARIALCETVDEAEKLWTLRRTYMLQRGYPLRRRLRSLMHSPLTLTTFLQIAAIFAKSKCQQS
jgi:hypothetical protein